MVGRKTVLIASGFLLLAVLLIICLWQKRSQADVVFDLHDGTKIKLMEVVHGKELHFHKGLSWEKLLFACGPHPLQRFRNYEVNLRPADTNGSLGLELRRFSQHKALPLWFWFLNLEEIVPPTNEVMGVRMVTSFGTAKVGPAQVCTEDTYWVFPASPERELHFRLYRTNYGAHIIVVTNEFFIPNPDFQ